MKAILRFCIVLMLIALYGCKSKEVVTKTVVRTDTLRFDSIVYQSEVIDTGKTTTALESYTEVMFADGKGIIRIDSSGQKSYQGVSSIKSRIVTHKQENKAVAATESGSAVKHNETSAIKTDTAKAPPVKTKTVKPKNWYYHVLAWIGAMCCLALILYAIFIYIKKKS